MHYKKAPRLRGAQRLSTWRFCAASAPCGATSLHCGWHVPRDKEQTAGGSNLRNPGTSVAIPSRRILAERSSPSRVRFAAPNSGAPLTAAGRSADVVVSENSVLAGKAEVMILVEIMLASTMNAVFVAFFARHLHLSQPCRPSRRDSCPSSPTRGSSTECAAPSMSQALRPSSVARAGPILVELALVASYRSTRNRPPLAAPSLRLVLGTEIAACSRKTRGESGDSRSDSAHEPSQPLAGSTPHSRRIAQARNRARAIDGCQVSAAKPKTAFPDLANLPAESCRADGLDRLFHGSHCNLSGAVCLRRPVA